MTTLIQQKTDNDCVLAAIAMAKGCEKWEDLWDEKRDLEPIIGKGIHDIESYLKRVGLVEDVDFKTVYTYGERPERTYELLWRRRALVSVNSLNGDKQGGKHLMYWDGTRVWDPNEGRPDRLHVKYLRSAVIGTVILLT